MAEAAEATIVDAQELPAAEQPVVFRGSAHSLVPAMAMILAGLLAFSMGMTDVYLARAMAWTFVAWGLLLAYANLLDVAKTYTLGSDALVIKNVLRPWGMTKVWDWEHILRVDIVVKKRDARLQDAVLQIYFTAPGEIVLEREDRALDPALARLVIDRAGLKPADRGNPQDLAALPQGKAVYTWN